MELTTKQKAAFGIGAVGRIWSTRCLPPYVMYYYQDVLGLPATFVGLILMIARVFDAFNDPFMGGCWWPRPAPAGDGSVRGSSAAPS